MESLDIMLVGCGMMGARHVRGYAELEKVRPGSLHLRAVCDPRGEASEQVAYEAEQLLSDRPEVYPSINAALAGNLTIEAVDVVTDNRSHDAVVIPLLEAGLDVLVEKPLAVTVARGQAMIETARRCDRILAVAENNRRDPMNRLMRHIVQEGFIGNPHFLTQTSITTGRRVLGSPWRHSMSNGGLALDVGIHQAYVLEMLLGPIETVYATSQRVWSKRQWRSPDDTVEEVPVESDDVFAATLTFESGAQGVWIMYFGSTGVGQWGRILLGERGTVEGPPDRSGKPVQVQRGNEVLVGDALVQALPDFHLNDIESRLFGMRPGGYTFESAETDRKLIAAELSDFADAVRTRRAPEAPGELGLRSVAVVYALLESSRCGQPVDIRDVLSGEVGEIQTQIESYRDA